MNIVTINQLGKIINAQFEELQIKITQLILEKEVQELIKEEKLGNIENFNKA
ncbi:hypothetical protein G9A89_015493 [Geosiphon pyriformis]|nr:hypothetical protein G9A89_015493 [Geosiphon pyriformis]